MAKLICSAVKYCIYEYPTKITVSSTSWSIPSHLDSIPGMGFIFLNSSSRLEPSLSGLCSGQFVKNDLGNKCLVGEWVAGWIQGDRRCALPIRLQIKSYSTRHNRHRKRKTREALFDGRKSDDLKHPSTHAWRLQQDVSEGGQLMNIQQRRIAA